jgi:two-component system response regulator (stage 0 sporulation protein A)
MLSSITNLENTNIYHFPSCRKHLEARNRTFDVELAASNFVKMIGIRPNLLGYKLLVTAIVEALKQSNTLTPLSKNIYPTIAKQYRVPVKAVERNIRRAIESAYIYDPERLTSVFYYKTGKPYVTEVISIAVETIKLECL